MPLLMCPNDNAAMTTMERSGVQFDMCPSCRGVWLDRGELEKLMDAASTEGPAPAQAAPPRDQGFQQGAQSYGNQPWKGDADRDRYRSEPRYRDDEYAYRKKKKRMDIFDIFD